MPRKHGKSAITGSRLTYPNLMPPKRYNGQKNFLQLQRLILAGQDFLTKTIIEAKFH
jgi:hypothetical protein